MRRNRRRCARYVPLRVVRDTETVLGEAILAGVLSGVPSDPRDAGRYRFHDEDGTAWLQHRATGAHVALPARKRTAGDAG